MTARRTCPTCREVRDYCIPLSLGECITCHYPDEVAQCVDRDPLIDAWREAA